MGIIKKFLLIILLFVGVIAGLVIASRYVPEEKWNGVAIGPQQLQPLIANSISKLQHIPLASSLQSLQGKVLGVKQEASPSSEASDSAKPANQSVSLPQKTFNYARYSYCKQVVEEYEKSQE
jgi:hypothetical protein